MVQGISIVDNFIIDKNPATGEEIGRIPCTVDVDGLVQTAHQAQPSWARHKDRIQLLRQGLIEIGKKSDVLSETIVKEMGKPIFEAEEELKWATQKDDYMTVLEESLRPVHYHSSNVEVRQPLGVVAVLSPWNFPCDEILLLVLPALASGNTVIVKPSEVTPLSGAITVQALASVLPDHVLQLAQGDGEVGAALVKHPLVSMVAMTGSSATGKKILKEAAPQMKRLVLEMGGKDAMVVMGDANLDKAAHDAVKNSLSNSGQVCCSIERIFVADTVYENFCDRVNREAAKYTVGDGRKRDTKVGPLASSIQREIVANQVNDAVAKGARLLFQSDIPVNTGDSSFHPVCVVADVTQDMKLYREETFGPVVTMIRFNGSEEHAIELANDTEYGLAASVYTNNVETAVDLSRGIQAGQIGINCYSVDNLDANAPWVGHKAVSNNSDMALMF